MRPWLLFACFPIVGCGAFGSSTPPGDGGLPEASADAATDSGVGEGDAGDGGSDAGFCKASRPQALRCGGTTCPRDNGGTCCADGDTTRYCGSDAKPCAGTQMNCQGNADCSGTDTCCQLGSFIGSACQGSCNGRPHYCYSSDECGAGEGCLPFPAAAFDNVWACAPCPF